MSEERRLESWKEIGAYLQKDLRTARRWEKEEGLPVHRQTHKRRASVYAYPSEIDAWRTSRKALPEPPPLWRTLLTGPRSLAFGVALASFLVMVGNGVRPQVASAQSKQTAKQVWGQADSADTLVDNSGSPSPDGRLLTLTDWATGDLAVRDLASGTVRRITKQAGPYSDGYAIASIPSPDARQVAYTWQKRTGAELRIIGADGSGMRILYSNPEFDYLEPSGFSPDSKQILTRLNASNESDKIALISAADGKARILKTLPWGTLGRLSLSPDGRSVAYDFHPQPGRPETKIMVLNADGTREVTLGESAAREQVFGWAPDGKALLFASERSGTRDLWAVQIVDGNAQGQPSLQRRAIGNALPLGIARNGTLFYSEVTSSNDVYIASMDWETGNLLEEPKAAGQKVQGVNRDPIWSPDGKQLAYVTQSGVRGSEAITIMNLETGEERQLSPKLSLIQRLTDWSRDGRWLLLMAFDEKKREGAYAVDSRNGEVRALAQAGNGQTIFIPQWSPDGKAIVYYRRDVTAPHSHIIVHELENGTERDLPFGPGDPGYIFMRLSPDGRYVAFLANGEDRLIGIVPVDGGAPRDLFRLRVPGGDMHLAGWRPNSREVIFETSRDVGSRTVDRQLWRIAADGGERVRLMANPPKTTLGGMFSFHPDGRHYAYSGTQGNGLEIWVLENFLSTTAPAR
jgi:Tol biopolymer transport system component